MVFEYMEHGDLADLLRKNDPSLGADRHFDLKQVSLFLSLIIVFDIHSEQTVLMYLYYSRNSLFENTAHKWKSLKKFIYMIFIALFF